MSDETTIRHELAIESTRRQLLIDAIIMHLLEIAEDWQVDPDDLFDYMKKRWTVVDAVRKDDEDKEEC